MDFQSEKSFGKLRLKMICMLKHVKDVKDYLRHLRHALIYTVFDGMVGKPEVSAFQNFFRIENPLSIKEVMSQNVCVCSFPIFDIHSITALRCIWSIFDIFDIHSITALRCIWSIFDIFDIHSITAVRCTLSIFDIFNIALIFCTVFNAFNAMYLNTSNIKQCALTHIDMRPLMYTQQIRWQLVWMSGFLTI